MAENPDIRLLRFELHQVEGLARKQLVIACNDDRPDDPAARGKTREERPPTVRFVLPWKLRALALEKAKGPAAMEKLGVALFAMAYNREFFDAELGVEELGRLRFWNELRGADEAADEGRGSLAAMARKLLGTSRTPHALVDATKGQTYRLRVEVSLDLPEKEVADWLWEGRAASEPTPGVTRTDAPPGSAHDASGTANTSDAVAGSDPPLATRQERPDAAGVPAPEPAGPDASARRPGGGVRGKMDSVGDFGVPPPAAASATPPTSSTSAINLERLPPLPAPQRSPSSEEVAPTPAAAPTPGSVPAANQGEARSSEQPSSGAGQPNRADGDAQRPETLHGERRGRSRLNLRRWALVAVATLTALTASLAYRLRTSARAPRETSVWFRYGTGQRSPIPKRLTPLQQPRVGIAIDSVGRSKAVLWRDSSIPASDNDWVWIRFRPVPTVGGMQIETIKVVHVELREFIGRPGESKVLVDVDGDGKPDYSGSMEGARPSGSCSLEGDGPFGRRLPCWSWNRNWLEGGVSDDQPIHWVLANVGAFRTVNIPNWERSDWSGWAHVQRDPTAETSPAIYDGFDEDLSFSRVDVDADTFTLSFWDGAKRCVLKRRGRTGTGSCESPYAAAAPPPRLVPADWEVTLDDPASPRQLTGSMVMDWPEEKMLSPESRQHPPGKLHFMICAELGPALNPTCAGATDGKGCSSPF